VPVHEVGQPVLHNDADAVVPRHDWEPQLQQTEGETRWGWQQM
jgi:hypothetical protein